MAHYATTIQSPWPAEEAFEYMADLRNFAEWDPGVSSSKLVVGIAPGEGAAYDVKVTGTKLRYKTVEYKAPDRTVVKAESPLLVSYDMIEVAPTASGCEVLYDAELKLKGPLALADWALQLAFDRIGDKAAAGMEKALDGKRK